jgi:4-coumarate--CoA ligase
VENGLTSMIEVYGSSETGGIGWREEAGSGYQLFAHWKKHDDERLESQTGSLCSLPDLVDWQTDRLLKPVRRRDDAVQVGGTNVWPEQVRSFIEGHPKVRACAVRPTDTDVGIRLKAYIVPKDMADKQITSELRLWLKSSLPAAERPVQLTVGEDLPRNSMGKLNDW